VSEQNKCFLTYHDIEEINKTFTSSHIAIGGIPTADCVKSDLFRDELDYIVKQIGFEDQGCDNRVLSDQYDSGIRIDWLTTKLSSDYNRFKGATQDTICLTLKHPIAVAPSGVQRRNIVPNAGIVTGRRRGTWSFEEKQNEYVYKRDGRILKEYRTYTYQCLPNVANIPKILKGHTLLYFRGISAGPSSYVSNVVRYLERALQQLENFPMSEVGLVLDTVHHTWKDKGGKIRKLSEKIIRLVLYYTTDEVENRKLAKALLLSQRIHHSLHITPTRPTLITAFGHKLEILQNIHNLRYQVDTKYASMFMPHSPHITNGTFCKLVALPTNDIKINACSVFEDLLSDPYTSTMLCPTVDDQGAVQDPQIQNIIIQNPVLKLPQDAGFLPDTKYAMCVCTGPTDKSFKLATLIQNTYAHIYPMQLKSTPHTSEGIPLGLQHLTTEIPLMLLSIPTQDTNSANTTPSTDARVTPSQNTNKDQITTSAMSTSMSNRNTHIQSTLLVGNQSDAIPSPSEIPNSRQIYQMLAQSLQQQQLIIQFLAQHDPLFNQSLSSSFPWLLHSNNSLNGPSQSNIPPGFANQYPYTSPETGEAQGSHPTSPTYPSIDPPNTTLFPNGHGASGNNG
jgi:hypothetical protein